MQLKVVSGDMIIFFGVFGDVLKHGPLGDNRQILLTLRCVNKNFLLKNKK